MPFALNITNFYDYDVKQVTDTIAKAKEAKQTVLPILVNSYGGSVYNCLRMVDALKASGMKLVTILNGYAMSAGSIIFAIGEERYMSENSTIMIHEASAMSWGKNSEMKALGQHIEELNSKLFNILDSQAKQDKGFFLNLVNKNNNADLFLNAEQAKEYGLVTEIKTPSPEEILNSQKTDFIQRNPWENLRFFMQYVPQQDENQDQITPDMSKKDQNIPVKKTNITKSKGVKMDLETLLQSLTDEQKEPIKALQSQLSTKNKEVENLTTSLDAKNKELSDIVAAHEKKLADIEANNDKTFLDSLKASSKLSQADYDSELSILASLSSNEKAKNAYKAKLSASASVVPSQVGINEQSVNANSNSSIYEKMEIYAKQNNLDLDKNSDYLKAREAVGGNK